MAQLTITPARRGTNGIDLGAGVAAAAGGDVFENTGSELLAIKNGGGGAITLTAVTPATVDGQAVADLTASIGAGETRLVGPFPTAYYSAGGVTGGNVSLTYSGVTSVTVTVVRFSPNT